MSAVRKDIKWVVNIHHFCTASLYLIFLMCIFMNLYVLLSRDDTIFYLRVYHSLIALLMFCCGVVEIEFLIRTRNLPKLEEPHEIPDPALIGAIALTIGIVLGYLYFIVFNYAFQDCDKLVDAIYSSEMYLEGIYDVLMASFSLLSLIYILQRRYYGAINSSLDKVGRLFINITFCIVWMKVIIYKGYLSHQELCHRKELEGYWCPVMKRNYQCSPSDDLHGTQKMWYYINKGILSTAIISCASEFFPVLLVTHWLACGGAEEKAEDIEKRRARRQGVRGLMREFAKDISRIYVSNSALNAPPLSIPKMIPYFFFLITPIVVLCNSVKWLIQFYYAIDFDNLVAKHWMINDYVALGCNILQLVFFGGIYLFAKIYLVNDRLDAHHKAHARGDITILFGCASVLFIKLILQSIELEYQKRDGFIYESDAIVNTISLACVQATQWLQYFAVRRVLAMSDRDCIATKRFIPLAAAGGLIIAWIQFGITFFDTSLIKYQLTDETFRFSDTTLICMIFTQTIFPADYLFSFTVSGCYLELLQRYLNIGFFQLGSPRLTVGGHGHGHGHGHSHVGEPDADHKDQNGHANGFSHMGNMASMMNAAQIMYRKRMESDVSDSGSSIISRKRVLSFADEAKNQ